MQKVRPRVYSIDGVTPVIHPSAFVHPEAVLIGDVIVEEGCYIGPCASLRGDFGRIIVRKGSNVQDNCTLHSLPGFDSVVGVDGHIGHGAIVHSAELGPNVLVGMNAVVMDHAKIGESAIIGAMSFVKAGARNPRPASRGGRSRARSCASFRPMKSRRRARAPGPTRNWPAVPWRRCARPSR